MLDSIRSARQDESVIICCSGGDDDITVGLMNESANSQYTVPATTRSRVQSSEGEMRRDEWWVEHGA